jgi:hypothetical protein
MRDDESIGGIAEALEKLNAKLDGAVAGGRRSRGRDREEDPPGVCAKRIEIAGSAPCGAQRGRRSPAVPRHDAALLQILRSQRRDHDLPGQDARAAGYRELTQWRGDRRRCAGPPRKRQDQRSRNEAIGRPGGGSRCFSQNVGQVRCVALAATRFVLFSCGDVGMPASRRVPLGRVAITGDGEHGIGPAKEFLKPSSVPVYEDCDA